MKKTFTFFSIAVIALLIIASCSNKEQANMIKDKKTLADVIAAVDEKFAETYGSDYTAVAMRMPIDEQYLSDYCDIDAASIDEYAGYVSMSMTNSDVFLAVKAKEGKSEEVKQALDKRLNDLEAQYEMYPVNGSYERVKAGGVYSKGDYIFLIVVGVMGGAAFETPDFSGDVQMVKATIDSMFT